jgi:CBS domain containing-hemolysin-like protein
MTGRELLIAAALLIVTTWSAVAEMALTVSIRSGNAPSHQGHGDSSRMTLRRREQMIISMSLLKTAAMLVFAVFVVFWCSQEEGVEQTTVTLEPLIKGGIIAVLVLWFCSGILADSITRSIGPAVVERTGLAVAGVGQIGRFISIPLGILDEIVRRLTGANLVKDDDQSKAEAELLRNIEAQHREGTLDEEAAEMLENVVELRSTDVGEIMTPRIEVVGLELTDDLDCIKALIVEAGHSRIPIYKESLDQIVGVLYVKDLITWLGETSGEFRLSQLLRQPIVVPETKLVSDLLADFQRAEVHMAIVVDEYGGTAGLVTIEDVLEEIVGEIHDEHDPEDQDEPDLVRIDRHRAKVDGRYHIDDLNEEMSLSLPEDEEYDTVGGYVLAIFGRIPVAGETIEDRGVQWTVLEATPTHIHRVELQVRGTTNGSGDGPVPDKESP